MISPKTIAINMVGNHVKLRLALITIPGQRTPIGNNIFPMNLHSATLSNSSFFSADMVLNPAIKKEPRVGLGAAPRQSGQRDISLLTR